MTRRTACKDRFAQRSHTKQQPSSTLLDSLVITAVPTTLHCAIEKWVRKFCSLKIYYWSIHCEIGTPLPTIIMICLVFPHLTSVCTARAANIGGDPAPS
ncbi:hypothetical protein J6590_027942 [Homalodisca vitripennis]|nr:hypothetical protein J6590_027942 [Homalodisca vitripennis]